MSTNNHRLVLDYIPDDGYTEHGYIAATPGIHGAFRFTFRPMLPEQQSRNSMAAQSMDADAYDRKAAALLAEHLVTWSLVDARDKDVEITPKSILRLKPKLFMRLWGIVLGSDATDTDPEWPEEAKDEKADEQYESALSGETPGAVRTGRDEKNSGAG